MEIKIDNVGFTFAGRQLVYSLYYFDSDAYSAPTYAEMFKKVLLKWASVFKDINRENSPMYLPFAPDDQEIECLKATQIGDKIRFTLVEVKENAYAVDLDDLREFITSPHHIAKESTEVLGNFDKTEVLTSLINATIVA